MKNIFRLFRKNPKENIKVIDMQSAPTQFKIGIIGVGCGGCNIINLMYDLKFHRDSLMVCDMDKSVLKRSKVKNKLQIGDKGLGGGNIPEEGNLAAKRELGKIKEYLNKNFECVIIITVLGEDVAPGLLP